MKQIFSLIALLLLSTMATATNHFAGDWLVQQAQDSSEHLTASADQRFTLKIRATDDEKVLGVSVHIANNFNGRMTITDSTIGTKNHIDLAVIGSTKMLAPPQYDPWERYITRAFPTMTEILVNDNEGTLTLLGPEAIFKCTRDLTGSS